MDVTIRLATPGDAAAITGLVRRCYGDSYRVPSVLDPAMTAAAIAGGSEAYAIATARDGAHVGQAALVREGTGRWSYCRGVVDAQARKGGLLTRLGSYLLDEVAPARGAEVVVGIPVTSHPFTQASCRSIGMVPLGLLFGVYPGYEAAGIGRDEQPTSIVLMGRRVARSARPRRVQLEGLDGDRVRTALAALGVDVAPARGGRAPDLGWRLRRDDGIGLTHIEPQAGPDRGDGLDDLQLEHLASDEACRLLWLDVPVEHPAAPALVERAREAGLSHGGLLPCGGPAGQDVLRLQRYLDPRPLARERVLVLPELVELRDALFAEVEEHQGAVACA